MELNHINKGVQVKKADLGSFTQLSPVGATIWLRPA